MGRCDVCGNDYEETMVIIIADRSGGAQMAGVPEHKVNA